MGWFVALLVVTAPGLGVDLEHTEIGQASTIDECHKMIEAKIQELKFPDHAQLHKLCLNFTPMRTDTNSIQQPPAVQIKYRSNP